MEIKIRRATGADCEGAIGTLRRSIAELCVADHRNDSEAVESWLSNKTDEAWRSWTARDDAIVLVAEREGKVVGVGMATLSGEILLNYVHPEARFSGVSKAVLACIEDALQACGVPFCRLESTITARKFYESCGFRPVATNASILIKPL